MGLDTRHFWTILGAFHLAGAAAACSADAGHEPGGGGSAGTGGSSAGRTSAEGNSAVGGEAGSGSPTLGCMTDGQCAPDICEDHECVDAECTGDSDCASDETCSQGRCQLESCDAQVTFTYTPGASAPTEVYVAGSFNGWAPNVTPLVEADDGSFSVTLSLAPGTHEYKFVVDGIWLRDEANPRVVDDGLGAQNSVLITDCGGAVPPECQDDDACASGQICEELSCVPAECLAPSDCQDAPYCVDGRCSQSSCAPETVFVYSTSGEPPLAVHLAGSFNGWSETADPLSLQGSGDWTVTIDSLEVGETYEYKFVVTTSGGAEWEFDPNNPRSNGSNSLAVIDCGGLVPPECTGDDECTAQICEDYQCVAPECIDADDCLDGEFCVGGRCSTSSCQPEVEFVYTPSGEAPISVHLAGSFNGWNETALPLTEQENGDWTVTLDTLQDGQSYEYKFVVVGSGGEQWVLDPNNPRSNGENSVALIDCNGLVPPECTADEDCTEQICEAFACVAPECTIEGGCLEGEDCVGGRCQSACVPQSTFVYTPPGAAPTSVHLAGSFNGWSETAEPLSAQEDGDWTVTLDTLEDGQSYEYKFVVVDGDGTHWVLDTNNLRNNGNNSLALIGCDGIVPPECVDDDGCDGDFICEDFACVSPECGIGPDCGSADLDCELGRCVAATCDHVFTYSGDATTVYVAGPFNGWSPTAWALSEVATDTWEGAYPLTAEAHEYKLVVDGSWMLDPANAETQNTNSLLNHTCEGASGN